MAYVLGYWYADGSMYISARGYYITVLSIDYGSILKIKHWLESEHCILKSYFPGNRKPIYTLRIGNKKLYNALLGHGLFPHKSLSVKFPDVPRQFLASFILGNLDGDGCLFIERAKGARGRKIIKKFSIIFSSGSREFLVALLANLRSILDLGQTKVYNSRRCYQLRFNTKDSLLVAHFLYTEEGRKMCLPRKLQIFKEYARLRPDRFLGECFVNGRLKG